MSNVLGGNGQEDPKQVKTSELALGEDDATDLGPPEMVGTRADHRDMLRMGKSQQLKVCIGP